MSDLVISARNLGKRFAIYDKAYHPLLDILFRGARQFHREFWALKDVSFDVARGETVGIVGRNGSGKSTLLQLICGTLTPTAGEVETHGRVAALLELGSGFNPQFTGRENVFLNGAILGLSREQIAERYDEIAAFADIGEFIDQPVQTYSSGMVVRLAFATAIHVSPDILVVDEALAVGDTAFQTKCLTRIRQMQTNGVSILLVTHNLNTIIEYCDRAIYLRRGDMIGAGTAREMAKRYSADLVSAEGGIAIQGPNAKLAAGPVSASSTNVVGNGPDGPISGIEIQGVELLDAEGRPSAAFQFGEYLTISIRVSANRQVLHPCFGIQLKSVDGIVLWSLTTQMLDAHLAAIAKGQTCLVKWNLQANFSGARYVVAIGAGEVVDGTYRRHNRLDYAGHFNVLPRRASGTGWLDPLAAIEVVAAD
jgi:lipopolysaccharide transport system ATP-binding protein